MNERIELACRPPEGYPPPQVLWLKNGVQIEPKRMAGQKLDDSPELFKSSKSFLIDQYDLNDAMTDRKHKSSKRVHRSMDQLSKGNQLNSRSGHYPSVWQPRKGAKLELMLGDSDRDTLDRSSGEFTTSNDSSSSHARHRNETQLDSAYQSKESVNPKGRAADKSIDSEDSDPEDEVLSNLTDLRLSLSQDLEEISKVHANRKGSQRSSSAMVITPEHSLRIGSFKKANAANYTCVAFNASGRRQSRTIALKGIYSHSN